MKNHQIMLKDWSQDTDTRIERRRHVPANMKFPRMTGVPVEGDIPMDWVRLYWLFRRFRATEGRIAIENELSRLGQDASALADRARGGMVGLAIGDAFATIKRGALDMNTMRTTLKGPPGRYAGEWTDPAGTAACVSYSLIHANGMDPNHLLLSLNCWYRYAAFTPRLECPEVGQSISELLDQYFEDESLLTPSTLGVNGAIRAIAPIVIFHAADSLDAVLHSVVRFAQMISVHADHVDACILMAFLLHRFLNGADKQALLGKCIPCPISFRSSKVQAIVNGSYHSKLSQQMLGTSDAAETLEAALGVIYRTNNFRDGLFECLDLGGGTVIRAATYGQLAGMIYGEIEVPIDLTMKVYCAHGFYDFGTKLLRRQE